MEGIEEDGRMECENMMKEKLEGREIMESGFKGGEEEVRVRRKYT